LEEGKAPKHAIAEAEETGDESIGVIDGLEAGMLRSFMCTIRTINGKEHLIGLKRTGGGIASGKYEENQKKIDMWLHMKRRKTTQ